MPRSTRALGDDFEIRTVEVLKGLLSSQDFVFQTKNYKIARQKEYFSPDRRKAIKFDVSVECFVKGSPQYSLLLVVECKNYTNRVSVGRVEEFQSKLHQISGHSSVKGLIFTTNAFQSGAIEYARSKNIGLIRVLPDGQVEWDTYRIAFSPYSRLVSHMTSDVVETALTDENYVGKSNFFFGLTPSSSYTSITRMFSEVLIDTNLGRIPEKEFWLSLDTKGSPRAKIQFLSNDQIEEIASSLISRSGIESSGTDPTREMEAILELAKHEFGFEASFIEDLGFNTLGEEILGRIQFAPNLIHVSSCLDWMSPRWKFTLCHEIAHLILHGSILDTGDGSRRDETGSPDDLSLYLDEKRQSTLEIQANLLAGAILLPRDAFLRAVARVVDIYGMTPKGFGYVYLDGQMCNIDIYLKLVRPLESAFGVSREVVKIRLKQFGLLTEAKSAKNFIGSRMLGLLRK